MDLSKIAATLKYGKFDGTSRKKLIAGYVVFATVFIAALVIAIVGLSAVQADSEEGFCSAKFVLAIVGFVLVFLGLPVLFLVFLIRNERARRDIILWMEDAVEMDAYCKKSEESWETEEYSTKPVKIGIKVSFKYNGKKYKFKSGKLSSIWKGYEGKSVNILFSPKYEQVMFLKQEL